MSRRIALLALTLLLLAGIPADARRPRRRTSRAATPTVPTTPGKREGMEAFRTEGCSGCHRTKDYRSPRSMKDLTRIGAALKPEEIRAFIRDPSGKTVFMPAFRLPETTLDSLVAYLSAQK